jgi:hypothetical protein
MHTKYRISKSPLAILCFALFAAMLAVSPTLAQDDLSGLLPGAGFQNLPTITGEPQVPLASGARVEASGKFTAGGGGRPPMLYITANVAPRHHLYSITQSPDGPIPTQIKLAPSESFTLAGEFTALQPPRKHFDPIAFKGIELAVGKTEGGVGQRYLTSMIS